MEVGRDYIGVGACAICHDGAGRLFLNKRGRACRDEWGKWDNCGGRLEFGESALTCIRRELKEEYGCRARSCQFGGVVEARREVAGEPTHWLILVYLVLLDPREAKNGEPDKFDAVGWFSLDNLPRERHSHFDRDFAQVKKLWAAFYRQPKKSSRSSTERTAAS